MALVRCSLDHNHTILYAVMLGSVFISLCLYLPGLCIHCLAYLRAPCLHLPLVDGRCISLAVFILPQHLFTLYPLPEGCRDTLGTMGHILACMCHIVSAEAFADQYTHLLRSSRDRREAVWHRHGSCAASSCRADAAGVAVRIFRPGHQEA